MDKLPEQVQSLPPELYSLIYELTFAADPGIRHISRQYKPPKLLTVDRASRELFARSYYNAGAIFLVNSVHCGKRWLASLSDIHLQRFRQLRFPGLMIGPITRKEDDYWWRSLLHLFPLQHHKIRQQIEPKLYADAIQWKATIGEGKEEVLVSSVEQLDALRSSLQQHVCIIFVLDNVA